MPILESQVYEAAWAFRYHHFSTIYSSLFRKIRDVNYQRQSLTTTDHDFIDLDWSRRGNKRLLLALHGLEGSSESVYIKGLVRAFNLHQWDAVVLNFRGCSGRLNLQRKCYHSGETEDLDFALQSIITATDYEEIVLVGFSLGGNVALKFAADKGSQLPTQLTKVIGVSAPIDLQACSVEIGRRRNYLYMQRFLFSLKKKFKQRRHLYPDLDANKILQARNFSDFDGAFTAPVHGFDSAEDYWFKCSSIFSLSKICVPTLIINAHDDSFLSASSTPETQAESHPFLYLLAPQYGGHVGFPQVHPQGLYWSEEQILTFCSQKHIKA